MNHNPVLMKTLLFFSVFFTGTTYTFYEFVIYCFRDQELEIRERSY